LSGGAGDDLYRYYSEAGDVRVSAWGEPAGAGMDTFSFEDLNLSDLSFALSEDSGTADGKYLEISFRDENNDLHTVQFANEGLQINFQKFADGSSFERVVFEEGGRVQLQGGDGDDVIYSSASGLGYYLQGGEGNDTLVANTEADGFQYLGGGLGDDLYEYHSAAGDVRVSAWGEELEGGWDTFKFMDVNLADVTFSLVDAAKVEDGKYLQASFTDEGGTEHKVQWANEGAQINFFEFADGSRFSGVSFNGSGRTYLHGTNEDDVIYSPSSAGNYYLQAGVGNDTIVANTDAAGIQYLSGREGNDHYEYHAAAGDVRVTAWGEPEGMGLDTFVFKDLNENELTFSHVAASNSADGIYLTASFTDENNHLHKVQFANEGKQINTFEFADGSTSNWDDFLLV
ncbi:MAG: hypothetical protein ACU0BN_07260, partial [Sulfitobacter sp.]